MEGMKRWRDLPAAERGSQSLPHAQMPPRGFYLIKQISRSQLQNKQRRDGPSLWSFLPFWGSKPSQTDSSLKDPTHLSMESELAAQSSAEQAEPSDTGGEEAQGLRLDIVEVRVPVVVTGVLLVIVVLSKHSVINRMSPMQQQVRTVPSSWLALTGWHPE